MSSISDAISKIRPDLNKQTKFQRGPETSGVAPVPSVAPDSRQAAKGEGRRGYVLPSLDQATTRLSLDDLMLPTTDSAPGAMRGWFGLTWLATTRSRVLASTLTAVCLAIGIGFFPSLEDVSGRPEAPDAALSPSAEATIAEAADAEAAAIARRRESAAQSAAKKVSESAAANAASSAPSAPIAPRVALMPIRMQAAAAATVPAQPALVVRSPGKNIDEAASSIAAPAPAMVSTASAMRPAMGVDEPLPPAPKTYPQVEEIFYEAVPSGSTAKAAVGAAAKPSTTASAAATPAKAPAASTPAPARIALSGIFWDEKTPMAMINGEIVEVGATVGGAKVIEIHQETVIVQQDGQRRTLAL